jgi:hypothetical protein
MHDTSCAHTDARCVRLWIGSINAHTSIKVRGLVWVQKEILIRERARAIAAAPAQHTPLTYSHTKINRDKCKDPECEEEKRLKRIKRLRMAMPGVIFTHPRGDMGRGPKALGCGMQGIVYPQGARPCGTTISNGSALLSPT